MAIDKHHVPVDGMWHDCPDCGYDGGWHVFFRRSRDRLSLDMNLQCPGCKKTFDLGLKVSTQD